MEAKDAALVLRDAGIEGAGSFNERLTRVSDRCAEFLVQMPPIESIPSANFKSEYGYAKRFLAQARKLRREADEERKGITRQLDEAKKAVMAYTDEAVAPLDDAIRLVEGVKGNAEREARAAKRARLETYWEQTYPALALCAGEAETPLVPFERIEDPDWTKRMGEVWSDVKPQADMDALADRLADAQTAINALSEPEETKTAALSHLFETLDLPEALARARAEELKRRDIERINAASPSVARVKAEDAPEAQPEPEEAPRWRVTIEGLGAEEVTRVRAVMVAAGIHGKIERM